MVEFWISFDNFIGSDKSSAEKEEQLTQRFSMLRIKREKEIKKLIFNNYLRINRLSLYRKQICIIRIYEIGIFKKNVPSNPIG